MKEIPDMELARVEELSNGGDLTCRWFDATLANETKCRVSYSESALYCHRHDAADCEGARRVLFILTGEKKKALALTLLGYELEMKDGEAEKIVPSRSLSLTR